MRTATALSVLALALLPAAAGAQSSPFSPIPPPSQTTETPTVTVAPPTNSTTGDSGLATWQEFLIFGAGLVLLLAAGTIDETMAALIQRKRAIVTAVTEGRRLDGDGMV